MGFIYQVSIYRVASDGCLEVRVCSEAEAEHLVMMLQPDELDYAELYRVHDVPEGTSPYEYIRNI